MKTSSRFLLIALMLALVSTSAFAQGGATSSITGVVSDSGGGVIPGASVTATNDATASKSTTVSNSTGSFTIPSLNIGTYTVTVELQGFKTAVLKAITISAGAPANVKATLEVGGLSETVIVESASEVIQTQASAASTTLNVTQISSLPLGSRNVLDFVQFLPGVQTPGGTRDSIVNGMPQSSINITVDGVSVQDNYLKTGDGFFARMSPRIDAVEQVTVTTAGQGADATSQGSTQIRFTTRSGSNVFSGSGYYYYQADELDANTYFNKVRNLPKGPRTQNQPGIRVGGPIVIPGLYDGRNKAFFFVNYEENRTPSTITSNTTVMKPATVFGNFGYPGGSVNVLALAAANGHVASVDPIVGPLLQQLRGSTDNAAGTYSEITGNPNSERFSFQQPVEGLTRYPTFRVDYNLPRQNVFTVSYNLNNLRSSPDTTNTRQDTYPGAGMSSSQISKRYTFSSSVKSVLGPNLVNEFRFGMSGGPTQFSPDLTTAMFDSQGGYTLGLGGGVGATGLPGAGSSAREGSTKLLENTLTYLKGAHSLSFGAGLTQADVWLLTQSRVPGITFGMATGDLSNNIFSATNMPGSVAADRNNAASLYALLTGRVSAITANARLNGSTGLYEYNGDSRAEGRLRNTEFFIQDNWKVKPNLSVNAGVRYVIQFPFYALNGSYSTATVADVWGRSGYKDGCNLSAATPETCNLFKPGELPGQTPTFQNLGEGVRAYNTDWNNLAPSVGFNWTPGFQEDRFSFLRPILGEQGRSSVSASWSRSFERYGMSDFTDVFATNPGISISATRNTANNNLGTVPLFYRNGYLGAPPSCSAGNTPGCLPDSPTYPLTDIVTGDVNIFDPDIQVSYSDTWTVGFQRQLGSKSAIEVRYVGARNRQQWQDYNYNESNIIENGFLDEFKLAQANLQAHIAQGCGGTGAACSFAYRGPNTGTSPLPIYLAFFSGVNKSLSGDAARYTSGNFTSSNFVNALSKNNPNPFTPAGTSATTGLSNDPTRRANGLAAGLPANFFFANPDLVGGAIVTGNGGFSDYNSMQLQYRRRFANGFQFNTNYSLGRADESRFYSFRVPRETQRNSGTDPGDVTHAWKADWVLELPFGAGKRWGSNAGGVLDRIIGGWQLNGTVRLQSGRLLDLGNVRVYGMSMDEVQSAFKIRKVNDEIIYTWPEDVVTESIKAYSLDPTSVTGYGSLGAPSGRYFAPANGADCIETINNNYGDCGVRSLILTGPVFKSVDLNIRKLVTLSGRQTFEFRMDMLNAFNMVNFTPVTGVGSTTEVGYQVTAVNGTNQARAIQIVTRFSW